MKRRITNLVSDIVMWCATLLGVLLGLLQVVFTVVAALSLLSWMFWLVVSPIRVYLSLPESMREKELAEKAVQIYHARINEGRCQENYEQASEKLKRSDSSRQKVLRPCEARQDFGIVRSTELNSSNIGFDSEGRFIELTYSTSFSNGVSEIERFIWRTKNNQLVLDSYRFVDPFEDVFP